MTTAIEWTDETWNPVVGCTKVSQGCKHCYAKTLHDKRHKAALAGKAIHPQYLKPFETVQLMPERLEQPLHWRKARRVFVNSVSDVFHEDVPDDYIAQIWGIMALARAHTFQVLTKRAERMQQLLSSADFREAVDIYAGHYALELTDPLDRRKDDLRATCPDLLETDEHWPLPNVEIGTSVEDRDAAQQRIPHLLATAAAVRFLSCEPLLASIENEVGIWLCIKANALGEVAEEADVYGYDRPGIGWVIVGGESGAKARPCNVEWIRGIVRACRQTGVPCFVKQLGAAPVVRNDWHCEDWPGGDAPLAEEYQPHYQGEIAPLALRDRKGGDPEEWPESLRVREFPAPRVPA